MHSELDCWILNRVISISTVTVVGFPDDVHHNIPSTKSFINVLPYFWFVSSLADDHLDEARRGGPFQFIIIATFSVCRSNQRLIISKICVFFLNMCFILNSWEKYFKLNFQTLVYFSPKSNKLEWTSFVKTLPQNQGSIKYLLKEKKKLIP